MKYQVSHTWSAYSTMLQKRNGNIAFYYEESHNGSDNVYDMIYCELPLEVVTARNYR